MKSNEILFAREMAEASEDLRRLNEILEDADKFRLKSNQVYYDITSKVKYAPFVAVARAANNLVPGAIPFEMITDHKQRRLIVLVLRQAVQGFIEGKTLEKIAKSGEKG